MEVSENSVKPVTKSPPVEKRHFQMFDSFRFFAFLKVFLQHVPIIVFAGFNFFRNGGIIGVQFFFVLSGFLITYIIFNEKSQTGTYNLKNFFVRRILRIWPLFYLLVGVSYCIPWILHLLHQPKTTHGYEPTWWVSVLFLENYKIIFTGRYPNEDELSVTWSLCIEEHFYLIWGLLLWVMPVKAFPKIVIGCVITALVSRVIFSHYNLDPADVFTNIDLFAIGAVPAYLLVFYGDKTEAFVSKIPRYVHVIFLCALIVYVLLLGQTKSVLTINIWQTTISGIIFSMLIFFSMHDNHYLRPSKILNKAGLYTYGLYMYHVLILVLLVRVFDKLHLSLDKPMNAVLYTVIALAGSYICSMLSYSYFEKPFLKMKRFFR